MKVEMQITRRRRPDEVIGHLARRTGRNLARLLMRDIADRDRPTGTPPAPQRNPVDLKTDSSSRVDLFVSRMVTMETDTVKSSMLNMRSFVYFSCHAD
ncbi:hypothetical protein EYF80_020967 [Liparis tanakae]|uniref:Uncharacterized protein n=1 Tax=Liparis tanakae TaxID=230148 RepID=A0A4Z2HSK9_9TELE|nr:hypothetical protein EYF80_020967 [Liparis tanakae]